MNLGVHLSDILIQIVVSLQLPPHVHTSEAPYIVLTLAVEVRTSVQAHTWQCKSVRGKEVSPLHHFLRFSAQWGSARNKSCT